VCGEAVNGFEGVQRVLELKPDVIILDFSMTQVNALQVALVLHEMVPDTPIIVFTIDKDGVIGQLVHNAGVPSVTLKSDQLTTLAGELQKLTGPRTNQRRKKLPWRLRAQRSLRINSIPLQH
jgi:DNA-binding NarL/FixJ family response regulator